MPAVKDEEAGAFVELMVSGKDDTSVIDAGVGTAAGGGMEEPVHGVGKKTWVRRCIYLIQRHHLRGIEV